MKPSRYVRPSAPIPLVVQRRDRAILSAIATHRYLRSDHVRRLFWPRATLARARRRLRALWAAHFVDRLYLPQVVAQSDAERPTNGRGLAIYSLARRGAELVAEERLENVDAIPHTPEANRVGYATLKHHLVVTDLLVDVEAAGGSLGLATTIRRETTFRQALHQARRNGFAGAAIVPDGAFTVFGAYGHRSFYVEVTRAGMKAGNESLRAKLDTYLRLNRERFFRRVYGDKTIRAVIWLFPTESRLNVALRLLKRIGRGHRFFWFGLYNERAGHVPAQTQPTAIFSTQFEDGLGTKHTIIEGIVGTHHYHHEYVPTDPAP